LPQPEEQTASRLTPVLVYRDRIGTRSEIQFLRRQYLGFTQLSPIWVGRHVMPDAAMLGGSVARLGDGHVLGSLERLLFRHFGFVPRLDIGTTANVVHAQFARGGALALPLAQALGKRLVVTLHGGDVSKSRNWQWTVQARRWPAVVTTAARFVCVSEAVAEIAARHDVPRSKITVLPIGVEVPDVPRMVTDGALPFLFVGRFVPKKGIDVLADAVRRLHATGAPVRLLCVGDGPLRSTLEAVARETGAVELTGWLPPAEVTRKMAGASALLVPSIVAPDGDAEGLPSVIPEAMAQATPVIGSAEGGIAEAIEHERTGLLVPPGNPAALAAAMARLASDAELRHALGQAAFAYVSARLNARVQSAALETLLLEVAS
jgi:colanic acid/amylovoran biosynthesis glycosyltransferase